MKLKLDMSGVARYSPIEENDENAICEWKRLLDENVIEFTAFADGDFVKNFREIVPDSEQFNYVKNTCNYFLNKEYDPNFVIVSRRAVLSPEPKPEAFWTTEHRTAYFGLRKEISGPARFHSSIMISTLGKLINHGLKDTCGGRSDGEISIDPSKPFSDFLFVYKPICEQKELNDYLIGGGMTKAEVLQKYYESSAKMLAEQGFNF